MENVNGKEHQVDVNYPPDMIKFWKNCDSYKKEVQKDNYWIWNVQEIH